MKSEDGMIRVGGVGTGRIFQWAHLNPYPRLLDGVRLVAFYDLDGARAKQAREKYAGVLKEYAESHPDKAAAVEANLAELRCHDSLDSLLDQVDVIDVCTTTRGRMPSAMAALEKGVHSLLEKPPARVWTEADRAARGFAASGKVFCQYNDDNVFDPKYRNIHDILHRGVIGNVQRMSLIRGSALSATSVLKSQASPIENGGGCLMDYGSHGIAASWYVLGTHLRPVRVDAIGIDVLFPNRVLEGDPYVMEVDDNARIKVLFEDPDTGRWVTLFFEATWCGGHIGLGEGEFAKRGGQGSGYLLIEGDEGVIDATEPESITVTRFDGGRTVYPIKPHPAERISLNDGIDSFIDGIRSGTPPEIDVRYGADVVAICGAAYLSKIRGRPVMIDEFKEYCRGFVTEYGDGVDADEAILKELLAPYKREARP